MKIPSLIAILAAAALLPASALTSDDITPASLPGKTFIFTIATHFGLPVRSGVWKGTFDDAPGTNFTITSVSGNMPNRADSYDAKSVDSSVPTTTIQLPRVFSGTGDFTALTLIVTGNNGTFSMSTFDLSSGSPTESTQTGTFTLEGASTAPEISVKLGTKPLIDGSAAKISIGTAKIRKKVTKKFTITNIGDADLTGLSVNVDGKNKGDFTIGKLAKKTLPGSSSTSLDVTFLPKSAGLKTAAIHIKSNDANENPFDILLTGTGVK